MKLCEAFEVARGDVIAFIGGGGKTSALVGLGYELVERGWRVLATTTTYIHADQLSLIPHAMRYTGDAEAVSKALSCHQFVFLYEDIVDDRVIAPNVEWTTELLDNVDSDVLLIEADKADGRSFKAPLDHEPAIPSETSLVVPVVALNVLDKPLDTAHVYNHQAMTEKYGFFPGTAVHAPWIGQVLRDEELGLKGVPARARVVAFLNQTTERGYNRQRARVIARSALKGSRIQSVAVGSVRAVQPIFEVQRSVGAIVLAAGMSTRMGEPKMLLPWVDDKPIILHIVEQLIRSRLDHIVVVTGHGSDEIKRLLKPLDVEVVHNKAYRTGEMLSSIKTGLKAMPASSAAAMLVLGDQPRLEPRVIYRVLKRYAEDTRHLVAPSYMRRRGHPIIIGRRYWKEILELPKDGSLRTVLERHNEDILYVDVDTDSILRDVDTPFEYNQERLRAGLEALNLEQRRSHQSE
jgi:molybdenum cofactor cytidylyltransferase